MIKTVNLSKSFGDKEVLKNLSIDFEKGKTTVVLGRSGTGKSVLLKVILRLLPIDSGEVYIDDINTTDFSESRMMRVRKKMGIMMTTMKKRLTKQAAAKGTWPELSRHLKELKVKYGFYLINNIHKSF